MSYVYKKNVKYVKNQINIYFFLWKTCVEATKVITNSLKTLDFMTPIHFDTFPWNVLCDLSLMKLGNNTEKKKARLWNSYFYRKIYLQRHESH